jgi:hypothetical protein
MTSVEEGQRRAFGIWLRTGRLPSIRNADGVELKFNPWHDPQDGRFTFAGAGRYHGKLVDSGSAGGPSGRQRNQGTSRTPDRAQRQPTTTLQRPSRSKASAGSDSSTGGPWSSSRTDHQRSSPTWGRGFSGGGGGDFGGGGASGDWGDEAPPPKTSARETSSPIGIVTGDVRARTPSPRTATAVEEKLRVVVRNGYTYQIDARNRTRHVSGVLTIADKPVRSRESQAEAGGPERRKTDDGGHYVAARFNGPTEAFNHFAQDANFNRGGYRLLEDQLARAKRGGHRVTVRIVPSYDGGSGRPSLINFWFTIDGDEESQRFPNEPAENVDGKR